MNLFEMFDKVNKTKSIVGFNQQKRLFENDNQIALFNNGDELNEDEINSDRRKEVLDLISQNQFENNPRDFYESLIKSKHPDMLTPYSVSELAQMKLFKVPGFNIGYALKKFEDKGFKEIVAAHNNELDIKNIGRELLQSAIRNGGCYLDHFDGFLSNLYSSLGFVEYKRDNFDPQYDPDNKFRDKYGESDVIYRVHKNCLNK